ncbi:uncharacterized protein B0P05DRAFT_573160 [Gilbertella persicaria]|uniref:uncharacterized protein n=1 Tax=Gilbertella persicaria TaxID=101096 RepID=UPI0022202B82|nr:uncharacterized protein B0P05DRAFT_573160 [Gilbertella persicaria]KAI8072242.1 hypothetical protein B0P05DRAFT_573160 [Gilbertella persicaria]
MVQKSLLLCVATAFLAGLQATSVDENTVNINLDNTSVLEKRHFFIDSNKCASGSYASQLLTQFSGVFFGDFKSVGKVDISGSLAVKGDFESHYSSINTNWDAGFSYENLKSYGLVVGGQCKSNSVSVSGASFIRGGLSGGAKRLFDFFKLYHGSTGYYSFEQSQENAYEASLLLSQLEPTLRLDAEGKLSACGTANHGFHVLHFNTCKSSAFHASLISEAAAFLSGKGSWSGPKGLNWPSSGTIVINIPIDIGASFSITNKEVSLGLDASRVIFNFYPADSQGKCHSGGKISLKREMSGYFGGFTLAPRADIFDGAAGAFAGTVIGHNFNCGGGIGIGGYHLAGGSSSSFKGCFPIHNNHTPPPATTIHVPPASATTTTPTNKHTTSTDGHSATTTAVSDKHHTTVAHKHQTTSVHHSKTTSAYKHQTTTDCGCGKHSTTKSHKHSKTVIKGKHHSKTTTKGKHHAKTTTKGKHHSKITTKGKHHSKITTKCKHHTKSKHHTKTKHTPTTCPVGCATKTVTKVVYVTVN